MHWDLISSLPLKSEGRGRNSISIILCCPIGTMKGLFSKTRVFYNIFLGSWFLRKVWSQLKPQMFTKLYLQLFSKGSWLTNEKCATAVVMATNRCSEVTNDRRHYALECSLTVALPGLFLRTSRSRLALLAKKHCCWVRISNSQVSNRVHQAIAKADFNSTSPALWGDAQPLLWCVLWWKIVKKHDDSLSVGIEWISYLLHFAFRLKCPCKKSRQPISPS